MIIFFRGALQAISVILLLLSFMDMILKVTKPNNEEVENQVFLNNIVHNPAIIL